MGFIQRRLSRYASLIVMVPRKCPSSSPIQETKRFPVNYIKLNVQYSAMLENKSSGAVACMDILKIDEMLAR